MTGYIAHVIFTIWMELKDHPSQNLEAVVLVSVFSDTLLFAGNLSSIDLNLHHTFKLLLLLLCCSGEELP